MTLRTAFILASLLAAVSCRSKSERPPQSVPTEPLTKAADASTVEGTVSEAAATPEQTGPQPYIEEVEIRGEYAVDARFREFSERYALMDSRDGRALLDLETLEIEEFPPFEAEHEGWPHIVNTWNGDWAFAWFQQSGRVEVEVLEFATMRWNAAPPIEVPPRPSAKKVKESQGKNLPGFTVRPGPDGVQVTISEDGKTFRHLELDPGTLVWEERPIDEVRADEPCPFPCRFPEADLVRWGKDYDGDACAAYRPSTDEPWQPLDVDDASCIRNCRRIPGGDVLVTGGIDECKLGIFDIRYARGAARIDVSEMKAKPIGETPPLGHRIDLGDDRLIWMRSGFVIRFDPETNSFDEEQGPLIEFDDTWQVRLDERTMLIGGVTERDGEQVPVAAKFGFR